MRAMQLREPAPAERHPLVEVELPDPVPAEGEIVLAVTACAVCRTDLQICEGDLVSRRLPIVPGHQIVGRIAAVGAGVTGWRVGERAGIAWLGSVDGTCGPCRAKRENLCEAARFTGWDRDGGFATRVAARADFALRLPDGFDDFDAAPLLCGGVIGYRALKAPGRRPSANAPGVSAPSGRAVTRSDRPCRSTRRSPSRPPATSSSPR
jgi:propanol-preferring alcohol dehydrogenase